MENNLPDGIFVDRPKEGAPEFLKLKMSFNVTKFIDYLNTHKNDKGYVNMDILKSKAGKLYPKLSEFKPKPKDNF